jgi:isoamylase
MTDQASYPHPLGVSLVSGGVNVALYSTVAQSVSFCMFDAAGNETEEPLSLVDGDVWHGWFDGIASGLE